MARWNWAAASARVAADCPLLPAAIAVDQKERIGRGRRCFHYLGGICPLRDSEQPLIEHIPLVETLPMHSGNPWIGPLEQSLVHQELHPLREAKPSGAQRLFVECLRHIGSLGPVGQ